MALTIPSYPNPYDPASPLTDAYAWISFLALDISRDEGRLVLNVHPSLEASSSPPLAQVNVALGQSGFPKLDELMASTQTIGDTGLTFAQAYSVIGMALYGQLLATVPALSGSTPL